MGDYFIIYGLTLCFYHVIRRLAGYMDNKKKKNSSVIIDVRFVAKDTLQIQSGNYCA